MLTEQSFKFKFVQNGYPKGVFSKKGTATEEALVLDGETVSFVDIADTTSRDDRLVLVLRDNQNLGEKTRQALDKNMLMLALSKIKTLTLEKHIDRYSSALVAEQQKRELENADRGELFRAVVCPHCQATINLTEYDKTPYIYCRFCESLLDQALTIKTNGDHYRLCDKCQLFDRVQGYTFFYFYFLLVVYGWRTQRYHLCDACAINQGWKALLINLIFLLGIPPSLYVLIKAQLGRDEHFKQLAKANKLARQGKYKEADALYKEILQKQPQHPAIMRNQAVGHLHGQEEAGTLTYLQESLQGSSNYLPTLRLIHQLQQANQANTSP